MAGRGRGGAGPANASAASPSTLCWWGTPWQPVPPGTCEPNHSETTGQMKPLSTVPRREGDTAVSVPAAPPRKARTAKGMGGAGNTPEPSPVLGAPRATHSGLPPVGPALVPAPRGLLTPGVPSPMSGKRQRHKVLSQPEREGVKHRVGAVTGPCCQDSLTGTNPWAAALLPGCALPRGPGWVSRQSPHSSYCRCPEGAQTPGRGLPLHGAGVHCLSSP